MKIRNLEITDRTPCRIIAEIGLLHHHQGFDGVLDAVQQCIENGADMVKTQMVNPRTAWWARGDQVERYANLEWSTDKWAKFFKKANELSEVPVFASVFDEWYLAESIKEAIPAYKLSYRVAINMPELTRLTYKTHKPIILSCDKNFNVFNIVSPPIGDFPILLWCTPKYPINRYDFQLQTLRYNMDGYSLHTDDFEILASAMMLGAKVLEVHVQGKDASGPDTSFALKMNELSRLCEIRNDVFELRKKIVSHDEENPFTKQDYFG